MRAMKKTAATLKIVAVIAAFLAAAACNPVEKGAKSESILIVQSITGTLADGVTTAMILESDVSVVKSDVAAVTLKASMLEPSGGVSGPSQYNDINLTGYKVDYTLPDGTGVPGTTVPLPITGASSSLLIKVGESKTVSLVVVLDSQKLAAPLAALMGTTTRLQVIAKITIEGQDLIGHTLQTTGQLTIFFGDY